MQVILIGYMGSGKTTVGKQLADELALEFLDLDTYIEEVHKTSVSSIFKDKGEIFFRKAEHGSLQEILQTKDHFVLATGGGTPCYAGNMGMMLEHTQAVFYLKMGIPALVDRLFTEKEQRPLIRNISKKDFPEFIGKHMFERSPFYSRAPHTILIDNKPLEAVVGEIKTALS
ncbi:shikimate kinase [Spongiimicrobium sp. 2-473A-2-J]|uniref:shikimate kinase n=1 Tax=Eudoraea algarum TaxID=3417568 RepID=UPI003D361FC2